MKDKDDDDEMMEEHEDPVPVLTRSHFEEGLAGARISVNAYDLEKYNQFRQKMDPAYKKASGGGSTIEWGEDNPYNEPEEDDDDGDIYD